MCPHSFITHPALFMFSFPQESDLTVNKVLRMVDKMYHYEVEIVSTFTDFDKCNSIGNLLVEKLHESIRISTPQYFHSTQKLDNLR